MITRCCFQFYGFVQVFGSVRIISCPFAKSKSEGLPFVHVQMRGGRGGLEHYAIAHEFGKVCVDDAVALLDGIVAGEDVLGIVVANPLQRGVFAIFRFAACHHRHAGLHVCVFGIATAQNEIAFKCTDAPDACGIAMRAGVCENGVFKRGAVVDAVVGVGRKVESEVGKIVFLPAPPYGAAGFEVEAVAFAPRRPLRLLRSSCFALSQPDAFGAGASSAPAIAMTYLSAFWRNA